MALHGQLLSLPTAEAGGILEALMKMTIVDEDISTTFGYASAPTISPPESDHRVVYLKIAFDDGDIIDAAGEFGLSKYDVELEHDRITWNKQTREYEINLTVYGDDVIGRG